ncbi:transcriptional regulator GutM [Euzebya tangerina]|uniref:transcriptional regulator GutM n=1 Tax=Euzebya tangerina TaxID=591198 RepID=UPI000E315270|nr:transcriptional regulator GutM [Euzebya tangerina]
MTNTTVLVLGLLFAALWIIQAWFATRQTKAFMAEVRILKTCGVTAVGSHSKRGLRAFVAMAASDDDEVLRATRFDGVSLFARPERYTDVEGHHLTEIATWDGSRVRLAAADSATHLLNRHTDAAATDPAATDT